MTTYDPSRSVTAKDLERMRDELRACVERAQEALRRTEALLEAARENRPPVERSTTPLGPE